MRTNHRDNGVYRHLQRMQNEINRAVDDWLTTDDQHTATQEARMSLQRMEVTLTDVRHALTRGDR